MHPVRLVGAVVAVMLLAVGCSDGADRVDVTTDDPPPVNSGSASPSPTSPSPASAYVTPSPAGPADLDVLGRVLAFARTPSQSAVEQIPFATEVALGLGDRVDKVAARADLVDPASWVLDRRAYGGRDGPFSVLNTLRDGGKTAVVSGPHNHCASPPLPMPAGFEQTRRISGQPTDIDSCINWWSVDLLLDADGRIAAVLLEIWDP